MLAELCRYRSIAAIDFVQIVNICRSHWVCVSNIFSPPGIVEVFDSMPAYSMTSSGLKRQVAAISEKSFSIHHVDVQRQRGGSDCGLFAVAFAASLCMGSDPHTERYNQPVTLLSVSRQGRSLLFKRGKGDSEDTVSSTERRLMSFACAVFHGTNTIGNEDPWCSV